MEEHLKRQVRIKSVTILIAVAILLVGVSLLSGANYSPEELVSDSQVCLDCHEDQAENLQGSVHQLTREAHGGLSVGCVGCHSGWESHVEDPTEALPFNPAKGTQADVVKACVGCHVEPHQTAMVDTDPHGRAGMICSDCHTVHGNDTPALVKDDQENFCTTCHPNVAAQFESRTAHPLLSENIRCTDCHDLGTNEDPFFAAGHNWQCQSCHGELSGPFLHEHPVTYSHLVEGDGCVECHMPHGSPNERLLQQPGDGLCFQCHGTPPRHMVAHGGIGTEFACAFCHSDLHGSFDNSKLLAPDLGMKLPFDCYQSGCHILGE